MKKIAMTIAALALVLSVGAVSAFAASPNSTNRQASRGGCSGFTDTDGDGVCDNLGSGRGYGFTDADGDGGEPRNEVLDAVLKLPEKYRQVLYLHYYEDYTAPQIGKILGKNPNTVYTLLTRGRQLLKQELGGDEDEG